MAGFRKGDLVRYVGPTEELKGKTGTVAHIYESPKSTALVQVSLDTGGNVIAADNELEFILPSSSDETRGKVCG